MMRRGNYERDARSGLLLPRGLRRHEHPQFMCMGPGFFGGLSGPGDANWANVSLLLPMNSSFADSSSSPKTVTATNATISTAQSKWGGASGLFNGTSAYLSVAYAAALNLVGVDFTLETWVYLAGYAASGNTQLISKDATGTTFPSYAMSISPAGKLNGVIGNSGGTATIQSATGTTTIALTTWTHLAVTRSGTTVRGFVAGNLDFTFTQSITMVDSGRVLTLGNSGSLIATDYLNGNIDDSRITKNVARYTSSFTPPAAAFPTHA